MSDLSDSFFPVPKPLPKERKEPKAPKRKNVERSADAFAYAYGSEERVEFLHTCSCIVPGCLSINIEVMHIQGGGGMKLKAHYTLTVPCCGGHHRTRRDSFHNLGSAELFESEHLVDLKALAADTERMWRRYSGNL